MPKRNNPGCRCCVQEARCLPCNIPIRALYGTRYYNTASSAVGTLPFILTPTTTNPDPSLMMAGASYYWDSGCVPLSADDLDYFQGGRRYLRVFFYCQPSGTTLTMLFALTFTSQADCTALKNGVATSYPSSFGQYLCAPNGCSVYDVVAGNGTGSPCPAAPNPVGYKVTE